MVDKGKKIHIPGRAKSFANTSLKSYKKHQGDFFDSKKELKLGYYMYLLDNLPETIEFMLKYGYIKKPEIMEVKKDIYEKLKDEKFVKFLIKQLEDDEEVGNIKLLPVIYREILETERSEAAKANVNNEEHQDVDVAMIKKLVEKILKKKIKKLTKAGVPENLAFDILTIVPCTDIFEYSRGYRIRMFFDTLYEYSKGMSVQFDTITDIIFDHSMYVPVIVFALLERKDKFSKLTDSQKTLYLDISNWCFSTMNNMKKDEIKEIINYFVQARQNSEKKGEDSNRRYALSQLSAEDYDKIAKVVQTMIVENPAIKKYL